MTRIAILTPYAPPVPGGVSTFVDGLSTLLLERGNTAWLLAGEGSGDRPDYSNLGSGQLYVSRALQILKSLDPEVVHCHGHRAMLTAGLRYRRWNPLARVVFSVHTTLDAPSSDGLRRELNDADVVTFVSATQLAEMRSKLRLGGDLRLLPPATRIQTPPADAVARWARENGIEGAHPVLMFAGPLEYPQKVAGVLDLVRSMHLVRAKHPGARLLIVGDGSLRPRVEESATGLGESVRVTGFVSDPSVALANATVYCHVSYQEGLPLAVLEAMSLGRCVLASPTGGIPEVIDGTNGRLVSGGHRAIADAILDLLAEPAEIARLGDAGRATVLDAYTWVARLGQLRSIYGGLAT